MPSKNFKSPFAPAFNSAIKRGTPCWTAVNNIATRTKKTPTVVFNSLCKAGLCFRQKINGQWIYWPCNMPKKTSIKNQKFCQTNMWQWFIEWSLATGCCTPEQLHKHCGTQPKFTNWCKKFWNRQFTTTTGTKSKPKKRTTPKARKPKSRKSYPATYKFPTIKSRPGTRKYRKVA